MYGERGVIGLRKENKSIWERRVALTPQQVQKLVQSGVKVLVESSSLRCYSDSEYQKVGAEVTEDISSASLIIGIKEVPSESLIPNRNYMFFSHVIKAQPYNMPMLDSVLAKNVTLIDYECIVDENNQRVVAFGKFAGNAGMIDFLQGLGKFLLMRQISSPFIYLGMSYNYPSLSNALEALKQVGDLIETEGLPDQLVPMIFGITGTGRCSQGAQKILKQLPHEFISPEDLENFNPGSQAKHKVYVVVFGTSHLVENRTTGTFDREEYRNYPGEYKAIFGTKYAKKLSVVVHTTYWEPLSPQLLKREDILGGDSRLLGVCDISCDLSGGVEFCRKFTTPESPFYLYEAEGDKVHSFLEKYAMDSLLYHSMDFLPSELPRDASQYFGKKLMPMITELASVDPEVPLMSLKVRSEISKAVIACRGELTPAFTYIQQMRSDSNGNKASKNIVAQILEEKPDLLDEIENASFGHMEVSEAFKKALGKLKEAFNSI